jgi:predicted HicB family RNase H-like nuclease
MKDVLKYKGFIGSVHFSTNDSVFFGKVEGVNDLLTFEGQSVDELVNAFHYIIDEHIKDCEKEKIEIEKSYKGSFNVRLSPELHRRIAISAKLRGESINKFISEVLSQSLASTN